LTQGQTHFSSVEGTDKNLPKATILPLDHWASPAGLGQLFMKVQCREIEKKAKCILVPLIPHEWGHCVPRKALSSKHQARFDIDPSTAPSSSDMNNLRYNEALLNL
jgi:hypothetical protein